MRTTTVLPVGVAAPPDTKWGREALRCLICAWRWVVVAPVDDDGYWWHGEQECPRCGEYCNVRDGEP